MIFIPARNVKDLHTYLPFDVNRKRRVHGKVKDDTRLQSFGGVLNFKVTLNGIAKEPLQVFIKKKNETKNKSHLSQQTPIGKRFNREKF